MDLCLFVEKGPEELSKKNARKFDLDLLYEARRILNRECRNFVGRIELVPAKVPILKFFDRLEVLTFIKSEMLSSLTCYTLEINLF